VLSNAQRCTTESSVSAELRHLIFETTDLDNLAAFLGAAAAAMRRSASELGVDMPRRADANCRALGIRWRRPISGGLMKLFDLASITLRSTAWLALASSAVAQTVVMSGLDNPRGLAFAPNGALYVAESGRGGTDRCVVNGNTGETRCVGKSGAISRLWNGQQTRVAEGLASHALPDGSSAIGPNDISFQGTGGAYISLGLGGTPAFHEALGGEHFGTLIHMAASGKWKLVADIQQHEIDENPAGGPIDSNPFGVLAEPGGRLVVDAGANALLRVAANRRIETLAVFPPHENTTGFGPPWIESVPTAVAAAPMVRCMSAS